MSRRALRPSIPARIVPVRPTAGVGMVALASLGVIPGIGAVAAANPTDPAQLAACDFGRQLSTYTFTDYDDYNRRVLDHSTGPFRDQFQRTSTDRRNQAVATHTSSDVLSVECGTDTADAAHAQIVVSVDDTTRSDATLGLPRPGRSVMQVYLDNVNGQWLTERVDPQPLPVSSPAH
ncbi:hypothetical protein KO481_21825 [Nocardia sp. NEAU-G5]|uniref:Mce-associated membrane protein n=1 Tax=Nocardia albiluteola TaxID=2842303 RepID=A0ABS6B1H6_9NOCA|nr:hypothetical protein [Nocardia albiluteola]MBU3064160.1 hypothetical protein [Nocardia albiluteola]